MTGRTRNDGKGVKALMMTKRNKSSYYNKRKVCNENNVVSVFVDCFAILAMIMWVD